MSEAAAAEARPPEEGKKETVSMSQIIGRLAHTLRKEISPGDRADLRRVAPGDFGGPAFWKIAAGHLAPLGQIATHGQLREKQEMQWLAIVSALAHIAELHDPSRRLGKTLAETDFSELRLTRLLRAEGPSLLNQVGLLVRFIGSKGVPVNVGDLANLILSDDRNDRERTRRGIARDYYASSFKEEN